jgi:hypothetical protein
MLALWALLIGMYVCIWTVLRSPQSGTRETSTADPGDSSPAITTVVPMVLFVLIGVVLFATTARTRRFNSANAQGLQALAEGDYARAADTFAELSRKYRWPTHLTGIATFNIGVARLHQGLLGEALDCFARVERRTNSALAGLRTTLACNTALAYALRGDLESARPWRAAAEDAKKRAADPTLVTGFVAFVDAVIDCREGRYESFLRWLDDRWSQLEGSMTARTTRPLRVLRAFAMTQAPGAGPRDAGGVEMLVGALQPVRPGEFAMLRAEWPEMAAFLSAAGL